MVHSVDRSKSAATRRAKRKRPPVRAHTDYLFPRPSFWSGFASAFDLFGRLNTYNYSRTGEEADRRGLYTDYYVVGQDFWDALRTFDTECSYKLPQQHRLFDPDEANRAR